MAGGLLMSQKERERLVVLSRVKAGGLLIKDASRILSLSYRSAQGGSDGANGLAMIECLLYKGLKLSDDVKTLCLRLSGRLFNTGVVFLLVFTLIGCVSSEGLYFAAPVLLPGTRPEMNTPGFWISLHPNPDDVVMSAEEIQLFNVHIRDEFECVKDISQYPLLYPGAWLQDSLKGSLKSISKRGYYGPGGKKVRAKFFRRIEANMDLAKIPEEVAVQFGFIAAYAAQRLLPTSTSLYSRKMNLAFDRLQNSALDIGTPIAIYHVTADGEWFYGVSPISSGWVEAEKVAICSLMDLTGHMCSSPFAVVTSAKADIFLDPALRNYHTRTRMGARFPLKVGEGQAAVEILIPSRLKDGSCKFISAFVRKSDVHKGYLPYTPRNVILQSFKLLNAPYGWGGMYGEQDCSRFIQEVFAPMGIMLPRNSTLQSKVGTPVAFFNDGDSEQDKIAILSDRILSGASTLWMEGHIMLFLGVVDGCPYAIHEIWGYSQPYWLGERVRIVNRAVVTNLRLGEGSLAGSLLERLKTIRVVDMDFPVGGVDLITYPH